MNLFTVGVFGLVFCNCIAWGKAVLDRQIIYQYLNQHNPHVAIALTNQKIQESKLISAQGEFDTKLGAKFDEKQYPLGDARFSDVYLEKPMESGLEMSVGYRKAYGLQEYNNIKTGDEGEYRAGVKFPVVELIKGMNPRKLSLKSAQIDSEGSVSDTTRHLRELYGDVVGTYYQLLYRYELMELENTLLEKAKTQYGMIQKRVTAGDEAPIALVEARQFVNERQQRWIESSNAASAVSEHMISYLNLSRQEYETSFEIPTFTHTPHNDLDAQNLLQKAIEKRPEIRILEYHKEKLNQELMMAQVLKYPKLDATVYGVHDRIYDNGFKVSLDMSFPLERQKYEGKNSEIRIRQENNAYEMKRLLLEIQRKIHTAVENITAVKKNLNVVSDEIALAEELERAEYRKFEMGESGLFFLNQRQMKTLEAKQKKAQYNLKYNIGLLELEKETGDLDALFLNLLKD